MYQRIITPILGALLAAAGQAGAAPAQTAAANPWDDRPETVFPAKVPSRGKPTAMRAQSLSDKHSTVAPVSASPFGAPVASAAPALNWGEPIALPPVAAAAVAAPSRAASATAPAVAASGATLTASAAATQIAVRQAALPAALSAAAPAATPAQPSWRLVRGIALHTQLQKWAIAAGWQLEWKLNRSWVVPADVKLEGTFDQAVEQVINALAGEGKPINLTLWEGNNVAEINETAAR